MIRDAYNEAALELEKKHLAQLEWVKGRPVLSAIVLRLVRFHSAMLLPKECIQKRGQLKLFN